jgi:hypothetical protein
MRLPAVGLGMEPCPSHVGQQPVSLQTLHVGLAMIPALKNWPPGLGSRQKA